MHLTISMEHGEFPGLWHWHATLESPKYVQTAGGWKFGNKRANAAMEEAIQEMEQFAKEVAQRDAEKG